MDFSLTPDQEALRGLAAQIVGDVCTPEHKKNISATESGTDLDLWRALADAGLAAIHLPESVGGGGYGWLEAAIVLAEIGRVAAPVPALAVMALAAPALAGHPHLLDGVAAGTTIVTAAMHEPVGDVWAPTTTVTDGRITGTKVCVAHGLLASRFVVTAADGLYVVGAAAEAGALRRRRRQDDAVRLARLLVDEHAAVAGRDDQHRRQAVAAAGQRLLQHVGAEQAAIGLQVKSALVAVAGEECQAGLAAARRQRVADIEGARELGAGEGRRIGGQKADVAHALPAQPVAQALYGMDLVGAIPGLQAALDATNARPAGAKVLADQQAAMAAFAAQNG